MVPCASEQWSLGARLYYRFLENMLRGEVSKGSVAATFSSVLIDAKFHRALLSCSFEIVRFVFNVRLSQIYGTDYR